MKYVVLLCDGMADTPVPELSGKTPMQAAHKPNMDALVKTSRTGLIKTVDDALSPGSDVANLSVMGYNPLDCYTGRSPLEAASIGVNLSDEDVTLRCNFITLSDDRPFEEKVMLDYCAGDIHTAESNELILALQDRFGGKEFAYYTGFSYRHCLVWHAGTTELGRLVPPHDITGRKIGAYLEKTPAARPLITMIREAAELLPRHPVNQERIRKGQPPANGIWLWGEGRKPALQPFREKFGIDGAVVSAVDLLKGIGKCAQMLVPEVEGATGYIDTNFEGKTQAALSALKEVDFVYLHLEAPDECGHRGEVENKVKSIELIDQKVLGPLLEGLRVFGAYKLLILPDHATPLAVRTHTSEPVPFLLYEPGKEEAGAPCFCEEDCNKTGIYIAQGYQLMEQFLR